MHHIEPIAHHGGSIFRGTLATRRRFPGHADGPDRPKPKEWNQWKQWTPAADAKDARSSQAAKSCPAVGSAHLRMAQTESVVLGGEGFVAGCENWASSHRGRQYGTCRQSWVLHFDLPTGPATSWFFGWRLLRWEHPWSATCCCEARTRITHSLPLPRAGSASQLSLISPPVSVRPGPFRLCWQRAVSATRSLPGSMPATQINSLI